MKTIRIIALDNQGFESWDREFDTIKDAKQFLKDTSAHKASGSTWWERMAESDTSGWAARNVHTVQLVVDGEVHSDWFPEFPASTPTSDKTCLECGVPIGDVSATRCRVCIAAQAPNPSPASSVPAPAEEVAPLEAMTSSTSPGLDTSGTDVPPASVGPFGIPTDFPVRPLAYSDEAKDRCTCGHCGLSWDDSIATSYTPAPSARCPFEAFHQYEDDAPSPAEPVKVLGWEHNLPWSFDGSCMLDSNGKNAATKTNAPLIIAAVNGRAAHLTKIQRLETALRGMLDYYEGNGSTQGFPVHLCPEHSAARAALA